MDQKTTSFRNFWAKFSAFRSQKRVFFDLFGKTSKRTPSGFGKSREISGFSGFWDLFGSRKVSWGGPAPSFWTNLSPAQTPRRHLGQFPKFGEDLGPKLKILGLGNPKPRISEKSWDPPPLFVLSNRIPRGYQQVLLTAQIRPLWQREGFFFEKHQQQIRNRLTNGMLRNLKK